MAHSRNHLEEILEKKSRLLKRSSRIEQFRRRVHGVVAGFRHVRDLDPATEFRRELMKYCPIGYIACVEGYFRLLIADLVNFGGKFRDNIVHFKDVKFGADAILAIQDQKLTLGDFVSHFLSMNHVSDINNAISTLIGEDFFSGLKVQPLSERNPRPLGEVYPKLIGDVEEFFQLRHLYAHELATKEQVSVRKIEHCMGMTAVFVLQTEEYASMQLFPLR